MAYASNFNWQYYSQLTEYERFKMIGIDLLLWIGKTELENYMESRGINMT